MGMRRSQIFIIGAFAAARCASASASHPEVVTDADRYLPAFELFIQSFGKAYTDSERPRRFAAFKANYDIIQTRNAQNNSYKLGITKFADLTPQEFAAMYGAPAPMNPRLTGIADLPILGIEPFRNLSVPASVDWSAQGAVSSVKSQDQCGACWAFAAAGAIEGAWKLATGTLVSLSEQQFVDCSGKFGTNGCKGGSMEAAIAYTVHAKLTNDVSYPYKAKEGTCQEDHNMIMIPEGGVVGYKHVKPQDEQALLEAVAERPVAVAIEADQTVFQLYSGGVLSNDACGAKIDHAVLVVGYGTDKGQDYWLIKNSWGTQWGEHGYVRFARKPGAGECGMTATPPIFAVVDGRKAQPMDIRATVIAASVALALLLLLAGGCWLRSRSRSARAPALLEAGRTNRVAPAPSAAPAPPAAPFARTSGGQRLGGAKGAHVGGSRLLQGGSEQQAPASQV